MCIGWKWEPDWLVQDFVTNVEPWVDEVVIVDDRANKTEFWGHEGKYRLKQRKLLEKAGADWAAISSPDERWENGAAETIRPLIEKLGKTKSLIGFPLCELWRATPESQIQIRTDGIWGRKRRTRMYPLLPGQRYTTRKLQTSPTPIEGGYRKIPTDVRLYHLKMIEPENRLARADAYQAMDPDHQLISRRAPQFQTLDGDHGNRFRAQGYKYLADEKGIELTDIPADRGFTPPYTQPYYFEPDWSLIKGGRPD